LACQYVAHHILPRRQDGGSDERFGIDRARIDRRARVDERRERFFVVRRSRARVLERRGAHARFERHAVRREHREQVIDRKNDPDRLVVEVKALAIGRIGREHPGVEADRHRPGILLAGRGEHARRERLRIRAKTEALRLSIPRFYVRAAFIAWSVLPRDGYGVFRVREQQRRRVRIRRKRAVDRAPLVRFDRRLDIGALDFGRRRELDDADQVTRPTETAIGKFRDIAHAELHVGRTLGNVRIDQDDATVSFEDDGIGDADECEHVFDATTPRPRRIEPALRHVGTRCDRAASWCHTIDIEPNE